MSKPAAKTEKSLSIQGAFIESLKSALPVGIGLAEELADLLNISIDSAYRRIRGETELTLNEAHKICNKYTISIDAVFGSKNDNVTFAYTRLTEERSSFETYMKRLISHLRTIDASGKGHIYYVAEEMPMFYSFYSKRLTAFKLFYWQRGVLNVPEYQQVKFEWDLLPSELIEDAHLSFKEYLNIPVTEIWSDETVQTGLRQIKFCLDSGLVTKEQAVLLMKDYREMVQMVYQNASTGTKQISDKSPTYTLYYSDVMLGTNCIFVNIGDTRHSYISFNTMNSLNTSNDAFCEETSHWIKNLIKKSTLISGVAEKQRFQFFDRMFKLIDQKLAEIEANG